jgi:hypothetical protein
MYQRYTRLVWFFNLLRHTILVVYTIIEYRIYYIPLSITGFFLSIIWYCILEDNGYHFIQYREYLFLLTRYEKSINSTIDCNRTDVSLDAHCFCWFDFDKPLFTLSVVHNTIKCSSESAVRVQTNANNRHTTVSSRLVSSTARKPIFPPKKFHPIIYQITCLFFDNSNHTDVFTPEEIASWAFNVHHSPRQIVLLLSHISLPFIITYYSTESSFSPIWP